MKKYLKHLFLLVASIAAVLVIIYKMDFLVEGNELVETPNEAKVSETNLNEMTSEEYTNLSNSLTINQEILNEDLQSPIITYQPIDPEEERKKLEQERKLASWNESGDKYEIKESTTLSTFGNAADLPRYQTYSSKTFGQIGYNTLYDINKEYNKVASVSEKVEVESNFLGNWNDDEINTFKNDCLRGLEDGNSQLSNNERKEYCDCMFEKIVTKYPDKYQSAETEFLMKIAKECIPSK